MQEFEEHLCGFSIFQCLLECHRKYIDSFLVDSQMNTVQCVRTSEFIRFTAGHRRERVVQQLVWTAMFLWTSNNEKTDSK